MNRKWKYAVGLLGLFLLSFVAKAAIDWEKEGVVEDAPVEKLVQITPVDDEAYTFQGARDWIPCWGCYPWSPDGELIVFQATLDGSSSNYNEICIIKPDGTGFKRLTNDGETPVCDSHGNFTPDGKKIVWQREVNGRAEIWIMNVDGTEKESLTQAHNGPVGGEGTCEQKPMVSPNGKKIAFRACEYEDESGSLWVMNIDGSNPVKVSGDLACPTKHSWSPDGRWILFSAQVEYDSGSYSRIFKVKPDGTDLTMLSEDEDVTICENWANWSPDGRWISYHRRDKTVSPHKSELWIMKPDGTRKQVLVSFEQDEQQDGEWVCAPHSWSPDSEYIVFKKYFNSESPLFIINVSTKEIQKLTTGYYDGRMWWSPNGKYILFKEYPRSSTHRDEGAYDRDLLVLFLEGFDYYVGGGGGGCFIATVAYGSPFERHVQVFREFRDRYLLTNKMGKNFVRWYYAHSPKYAQIIAKSEVLKTITRIMLSPLYLFALIVVKGILPYLTLGLATGILIFRKLERA